MTNAEDPRDERGSRPGWRFWSLHPLRPDPAVLVSSGRDDGLRCWDVSPGLRLHPGSSTTTTSH